MRAAAQAERSNRPHKLDYLSCAEGFNDADPIRVVSEYKHKITREFSAGRGCRLNLVPQ